MLCDFEFSAADSNEEYIVKDAHVSPLRVQPERGSFLNDHILATVDGIGMTDRQAMRLISAVVQSLGFRLENLVLSRSTIRRKHIDYREKNAKIIKNQFKVHKFTIS